MKEKPAHNLVVVSLIQRLSIVCSERFSTAAIFLFGASLNVVSLWGVVRLLRTSSQSAVVISA
jgi:hypothetical protein